MIRFVSQGAWSCVIAIIGTAMAASPGFASDGPVLGRSETADDPTSIEVLSRAVSGELGDVAGALRGLDQSYVFRGMQGCGSATAGSVYIDWDAKGVPPEHRVRVLPPQPLVLSESNKQPCLKREPEPQPTPAPVQSTPSVPAPSQPCPCQSATPQTSAPPALVADVPVPGCSQCGRIVVEGRTVNPPVYSAEYEQLAEVYYHGQRQCGGRVPPQVMNVHGQWSELHANYYDGRYPAFNVRIAPQGYGVPVW